MDVFRQFFGLIAILAIVIALIPIFIPDEEYSAGAQEWFDIANRPSNVPAQQNRFHAEVGFGAAANSNFIQHGADMVAAANQQLSTNSTEFAETWSNPALIVSEALHQLDFDTMLEDPLAWIETNRAFVQTLVSDNDILLERYRVINALQDYAYTMAPDYRAPIPGYSNLTKIHQLNSLRIAISIVNGSDKLSSLQRQIEARRLALAQAESMIDKLINLAFLRFDLQLYGALLSKPEIAAQHQVIPGLNAGERTLRKPFITEFVSASVLLDDSFNNVVGSDIERWLVRLYLKKRKFENHVHKHSWARLLAMESKPLAERRYLNEESTHSLWDKFSDPIGYILFEVAKPSFGYHDRIEHLDGLITLVNSAADIHRRDMTNEEISIFIQTVDAGRHAGYAGANLTYDAAQDRLGFEIPGYVVEATEYAVDAPFELSLGRR